MNFKRNPHAPKWHCFSCFHVMDNKEYKIWYLVIYQNIWSYNLEFKNIIYIYIKSNYLWPSDTMTRARWFRWTHGSSKGASSSSSVIGLWFKWRLKVIFFCLCNAAQVYKCVPQSEHLVIRRLETFTVVRFQESRNVTEFQLRNMAKEAER
jgi:hypothetical protein